MCERFLFMGGGGVLMEKKVEYFKVLLLRH